MYSLPEQINSANRAGIETFTTFANVAFSGAERVLALNINTVRSFLEEGSSASRSWLGAKNIQDVVSLQATLVKPEIDKFGTYAGRAFDIASKAQDEISQLADTRVAEINTQLDQALDKMAKNAPAGSDLTMQALRSVLSAANTAYRDMNKATKQLTEMAEASIAVGSATQKYARKAV